ncbi:MAG: aminotransferase class I/II-fold pyridoxal phosphate-dependent enzyme [Planctomycetota bacterium]
MTAEVCKADLEKRYEEFKAENLALDMTRGKPCSEQLDLANGMLEVVTAADFKDETGTDCRNYGGVDGLPAAKKLFADFLEVAEDEIIVGGSSSLNLMYDTVVRALLLGVPGGDKPWSKEEKVKFLCPAPGYDRHFSVCEHFGIEMITVKMNADGPDMDEIEKLAGSDASIKGIWCVPKYGNPTGTTYSDDVVDRLAKMNTAASDFRIFWDNAYTVHHLNETPDKLKNILTACKDAGNADRVYIFGSTSKVSFAGAGVGVMGGSKTNMEALVGSISMQTIGPDKLNQLRHVRFFKDMAGIEAHMKKHADIIKPKFDAVLKILERELGGKDIAEWTNPNGGYFVSLNVPAGCAKKVVAMAADAGVKLTGAGATFPYKKDPEDSNIRIAPTLPGLDEIKKAMEIVCICIMLVSMDK